MTGEESEALVGDRNSLIIGPPDPERVRRDLESEPPIREMHQRSQIFLTVVAFVTTFLLVVGLITGWVPLLLVHFVSEFMLVLVVGTILWEDARIDQGTRMMWAAAFLLMAPIAIPAYTLRYVFGSPSRTATSALS